jgi:PAS domain S-box-containing protein
MVTAQQQTMTSIDPETRAMIVADHEGIILEWNDAAEAIFGYSATQAIGRKIDLVVPEEERADHWRGYQRVFATNIINYSPDHILDVEGVRQDGSRVALDAMLRPVRDDGGRIVAIAALVCEQTDVSTV